MKFSSADFVSSFTVATIKPRRPKLTCLRQGQILLPIAPPSPLFAGINQRDINSEGFPDIVDLKDPRPADATLEHCVIHCVHAVCVQMVEATRREGYPPYRCNCAKMVEPQSVAIACIPRLIESMNDDTIQNIMDATTSTKCDIEIVLYEEGCDEILTALQRYFATSSVYVRTLILNLSKEMPSEKVTAAAYEARKMVFNNLAEYFDRTFALYDPTSAVGTKCRIVNTASFLYELENYLLTVLTDFMETYCDWILSSGSQYPPTVRVYIEEGGIPKIVWDSWNEIIAHLMRMLQWKDAKSKK